MPTKITKLTKEQIARFGEWSREWLAIGLSTEPANFDRATAAALRAYELCNLERPMVVLRMGSPYAATVGGGIAWGMLSEMIKTKKKVGIQVESQVGIQVESQVGSQVRSQVGSQVSYNYRSGAFWAGWGAYVSYLRDVAGWDNPILERFQIDEELIKNCGWVWWHENVLAISDRPAVLHRDDAGRLHCENGPSIAYRDGWSLWHWHGTAVPESWIIDKLSLTAVTALRWENIEQRRAACEIVGWHRILRELDAKTIDNDTDPQIGELLEVTLPDAGKERFLRVLCGTGREFAIPVPRDMKTALQANAWTYDIPLNLLQQKEIRT